MEEISLTKDAESDARAATRLAALWTEMEGLQARPVG